MSKRKIITDVKRIIPPLTSKMHKGQAGRVGVIGGSQDYTGAPFFASMSALKMGCDLAHVICEPDAGQVIKTYSPDLIVHPILRKDGDLAAIHKEMEGILSRLHALVIGPGLGRSDHMQDFARTALSYARKNKMFVVLDADALWLVSKDNSVVKGYTRAVLTPNVVEFGRLQESLGIPKDAPADNLAAEVAKRLGGVTILQKGEEDVISNNARTELSDVQGGLKRCGGQGDVLSGTAGTFLAWGKNYLDGGLDEGDAGVEKLKEQDVPILAAYGASVITRTSSRIAFGKLGRGVVTGNILEEVGAAYVEVFGEEGEKGWKGDMKEGRL